MALKIFPYGFFPGSVLTVKGSLNVYADSFEINLQCGPVVPRDIASHIALHFNPRFGENEMVRNSKTNGFWGYEEREGGFFFSPGSDFTMKIHSESRGFKINIDDFPFIYYKHRLELSTVTHVTIVGDVMIHDINYKPAPVYQEEFCVPPPTIAHKYGLANFNFGSVVEVTGRVKGLIDRFSVNMVCGKDPEIDEELCHPVTVALHISVRFDQNIIVRNSMINGEWGSEERGGHFVFNREEDFSLKCKSEDDEFQIFVNGVLFTTYRHRIDPSTISYIHIHGGIYLYDVVCS